MSGQLSCLLKHGRHCTDVIMRMATGIRLVIESQDLDKQIIAKTYLDHHVMHEIKIFLQSHNLELWAEIP